MDIKVELMNKFTEIIDVYYEKEANHNFLRVKTNLTNLKAIEHLTHQVSHFLDEINYGHHQYYLDIFSAGTSISSEEIKKLSKN